MSRRQRASRRAKYPLDAHLILIERRATREPIVMEAEPVGPRPAPTGFWRGETFYSIMKILGRRFEKGETFLRVLADRGCFDLHRATDVDPWTWRVRGRWELTAELTAMPIRPHTS